MTDEDERIVAERDDLAMMQRPDLWPYPNVLPLKRRGRRGVTHYGVLGVTPSLIEAKRWLWWEDATMFEHLPVGDALTLTADGLRMLVNQGWGVD